MELAFYIAQLKSRLTRKKPGRSFLDVPIPIGVAIATLIFWEFLVWALSIKTIILPAPTTILYIIYSRWPLLLNHLWPTLYQTVLGFLMSVAGGVAIAILITYSRFFRAGFYPIIVVAQIIPKISVAPLFIVWFGMGATPRLLIAFLISFFPIVINTAQGLQSVDEDMLRLAASVTGTKWMIFKKIRVPNALPYIFSGMKIAITLSVIGIIVAEFVAAQKGLGYLIIFSQGLLDTPLMMAAIFVLSIVGLGLYWIIVALEGLIIYWETQE